jgi:predicted transcriptional regulator
MNKREAREEKFKEIWGGAVASHGFLMVPNFLIRNLNLLGITRNEAMVLIYIMSRPEGWNISANQIALAYSISKNTVRTCFRTLRKKELLYRSYGNGEANTFKYIKTVRAIKKLADEEVRRPSQKLGSLSENENMDIIDSNKDVSSFRYPSIQKDDTNKDSPQTIKILTGREVL